MVVPRNWSPIEAQRSPSQTSTIAEPSATDGRFKFGAFFLLCSWLTTIYSLQHSIKHYKPLNRGVFNRFLGFLKYTPPKFLLTLPLSFGLIAYAVACSFDFVISPLNLNADLGTMYGWGWGTLTLIILVFEVAGYLDPNEDRELIRQRRIREEEIDQEMGIAKKPNWWSLLHRDNTQLSVHQRITNNVVEIGGGSATTRGMETNIEMGNMPVSKDMQQRIGERPGKGDLEAVRAAAGLLFPATSNEGASQPYSDWRDRGRSPGPTRKSRTRSDRSDSPETHGSSDTLTAPPQQVRSMLDV